jgi:hypothetical protein
VSLPITPENFAAVLIAAGTGASAVLTAIGGWALWKKQKEPPPAGSPDALIIAVAQLTKSMDGVGGQFGANLVLFEKTVTMMKDMAEDMEETRRLTQQIEQHQAVIRDATNRMSR